MSISYVNLDLNKLGFKEVGKVFIFSIARNEKVSHTKVELNII